MFKAPDIQKLTQAKDVQGLTRLLANKKADLRIAAAASLARIHDPASAGTLLAAVRDEDGRVRAAAIEGLGNIAYSHGHKKPFADADVTPVLVDRLNDPEVAVRRAAAKANGRFFDGRALEPLLTSLASDPDREVRVNALAALAAMVAVGIGRDARTAAAIFAIFQRESEAGVLDAAWLEAFGSAFFSFLSAGQQLLPPEALTLVVDRLENTLREQGFEAYVIDTLGEIGGSRCVAIIEDAWARLRYKSAAEGKSVAAALRKISGPAAFEALLSCAEASASLVATFEEAIVARAGEAGASGDVSVVPGLLRWAAKDAHDGGLDYGFGLEYRRVAREALVAYGPAAAEPLRAMLRNPAAPMLLDGERMLREMGLAQDPSSTGPAA